MAIQGETIESPRELFVHKLGTALKMENKILEVLPQLEQAAKGSELKQSLSRHRQETKAHVRNLEQAFRSVGAQPEDQPSPAIEGLEKEGQSTLRQVDDSLNDAVILSAIVETEAHEIAVYDGLLTQADALGDEDIVALLQENLENEQQTLQRARKAMTQLVQRVGARA